MNPAIAIIPGHAFAAWETWENSGKWKFLETTMIGTHTFEEACASGEKTAEQYGKIGRLKLRLISGLRTLYGMMAQLEFWQCEWFPGEKKTMSIFYFSPE